jgi:AraC-like DNA-binding protein
MSLIRMSSAEFPEAHRLEASVEFYARVGAMDIDPAPGTPFDFSMRMAEASGLLVGDISVTGCTARRSTREVGASSNVVVLGIALGPEIGMAIEGCARAAYGDGQGFVWDGERVGEAHYRAPRSRLLNIALPRDAAVEAGCDLAAVSGEPIPQTPLLRLLSRYALAYLDEADGLMGPARDLAGQHMRDLSLLLLGAGSDHARAAQSGGLRAARLAAIKSDIRGHLSDASLNVRSITSRHSISERYLRALFADEGTSFTDFVRSERLQRAARLLADPRQAGRRISDIAYDTGFADLSYFNRMFRARFEMTPSDYRAQALAPRS